VPSYIYFKTANLSRYDDRNKVNRPDRGLLEWNAAIVAAKIVLFTSKYNSLLFSNSSLGSRVTLPLISSGSVGLEASIPGSHHHCRRILFNLESSGQ